MPLQAPLCPLRLLPLLLLPLLLLAPGSLHGDLRRRPPKLKGNDLGSEGLCMCVGGGGGVWVDG